MWRGQEGRILSRDEVERRASGRRHYNSWRQFCALNRQRVVIARQLGVHPSTISRDIQMLMALRPGACPTCGRFFVPAWANDPSPFAP